MRVAAFLYNTTLSAETVDGVMDMEHSAEKQKTFLERDFPDLRLQPDGRLCPLYDGWGIALFPTADVDEMGFRVLDDFCEEHMM